MAQRRGKFNSSKNPGAGEEEWGSANAPKWRKLPDLLVQSGGSHEQEIIVKQAHPPETVVEDGWDGGGGGGEKRRGSLRKEG